MKITIEGNAKEIARFLHNSACLTSNRMVEQYNNAFDTVKKAMEDGNGDHCKPCEARFECDETNAPEKESDDEDYSAADCGRYKIGRQIIERVLSRHPEGVHMTAKEILGDHNMFDETPLTNVGFGRMLNKKAFASYLEERGIYLWLGTTTNNRQRYYIKYAQKEGAKEIAGIIQKLQNRRSGELELSSVLDKLGEIHKGQKLFTLLPGEEELLNSYLGTNQK